MSARKPSKSRALAGQVPVGRPSEDEERPPLRTVTFLASPEVLEAIKRLAEDVDEERGKQSIAIRKAILDQATLRKSRQAS